MNPENELTEVNEYDLMLKNNELIKAKLETLQFQNNTLKNQIKMLEDNENSGLMKTPIKANKQPKNEIDKNSYIAMIINQASLIENFINEKVL